MAMLLESQFLLVLASDLQNDEFASIVAVFLEEFLNNFPLSLFDEQ